MKNYLQTFTRTTGGGRNGGSILKRYLTLLFVFLVTGTGLAQTETSVECTNAVSGSSSRWASKTFDNDITVTYEDIANNNGYHTVNANQTIKITTTNTNKTFTKVKVTARSGEGTFDATITSILDGKLTTTGINANSVIITSTAEVRVNSLTVYYTTGGGGDTDVAPTFSSVTATPASVKVNETITLSAEATGTPSEITYTWYKNTTNSTTGGTQIGTGSTITTTEATAGTYYYYCVATNTKGSTTSNIVAVTVTEETGEITYETMTMTPAIKDVKVNGTFELNVTLPKIGGSDVRNTHFKWFVSSSEEYNGTEIAPQEGKDDTYRKNKMTATTPGVYYYYAELQATSKNDQNTLHYYRSNFSVITVSENTSGLFIKNPVESMTETSIGKIVALSIGISGGTSPKYQWYSNTTASTEGGTAIAGATNSAYSFTATEAGTFYYYCVVTCSNGTLTSGVATVIVKSTVTPTIEATKFSVAVGKTHQLDTKASANGEIITDQLTFTYTSENTAIATVDANGLVTGVAVGTTNITIQSDAVQDKYEEASRQVVVNVVAADASIIPAVKFTAAQGTGDTGYDLPTSQDTPYKGNALSITLEPAEAVSGKYEIRYTTDGSTPTTSSSKYGSPIKITETTFFKAAVYRTDTKKWGPVTDYTFRFDFTLIKKLANGQQIEPGIGYPINNADETETYIITTYGSLGDTGDDNKKLWEAGTKDSNMNNSYIQGFDYHAIGNKDAQGEPEKDENGNYKVDNNGKNIFSKYDGSTASSTFDIPINGAYIKFEPKMDGQVNMIVRQNGMIANDKDPDYKHVRRRYANVCDETGKPLDRDNDKFTAMISSNSIINAKIFEFGQVAFTDGNQATVAQSEEKLQSYKEELYKANKEILPADFTTTNTDEKEIAKDFWKYCYDKYTVGKKTSYIGNVLSYDAEHYGYYPIDKAYIRYSFPVKAGKTYFLMGRWTKLAPCGYSFKRAKKDAEWDNAMKGRDITVDGSADNVAELPAEIAANDGVSAVNITLNRTFKAGAWTSLVLPFSVSPTEVVENFGEGTEIVHFNKVEGETLFLTKHYHQMIVAGTPVLIKPANEVTAVKFVGTYEPAKAINEMSYKNSWTMTGSYLPATVPAGAYMMGTDKTTGESVMHRMQNNKLVAGTRAWLVNKANPSAKIVSLNFNGVEDSGTTAIENIFDEPETVKGNSKGIYNLNGQMVRANGDTTGLPAGIYIVNGKKTVVNK